MDLNNPAFYFGREYDLESKKADPEKPVLYDPEDLTTHAVITGMTGSGKTGMGIILLEEAALKGIPAILIDPKGDLTNELLHFPSLLPSDFEPWVDADAARREGKTPAEAAAEASANWRKGLTEWGIDKSWLLKLSDKVDYAIYTPGSDSAFPVSILSSLKAPDIDWDENTEVLRENISSTVTALLELVGFRNIDPVRSREHILLSNIFENAWSNGQDLDLESLILQTQNPPFDKLGVFPISKFYPEKERFELAMMLNNFLAAPAFSTWLKGQPLDVASFLYTPEGKPRHSVFYIAHLSDQERMFFVTLLYSAVETWMRNQSGTTNLRALVYFDEIVGYLPPVASPPSKPIIIRMLKQARAFGVGMVLATQNPIDLDYKALSNTGTWMIGKLQTEQDKGRLLDGLESLSGGYDRSFFDKTISALGKRVFLLHNIHAKKPLIYTTRWAMNYLPGPITRNKLDDLNRLVGAEAIEPVSVEKEAKRTVAGPDGEPVAVRADVLGNATEPMLASRVKVQYLPMNLTLSEALRARPVQVPDGTPNPSTFYQPALIGQATVYYANRTYNVDEQRKVTVSIPKLEGRGLVRWQDYITNELDAGSMEATPVPNASFGDLVYPFDDEKNIQQLEKDFAEWIYRNQGLTLFQSPSQKMVSKPGESREDFEDRVRHAGSGASEAEIEKIKAKYKKQRETIETRKLKEEMELDKDKMTLNQRKMEEAGAGIQNVLKMLGKRKANINTNLTKRRMTATAKANVEESEQMIALYTQQLAELDDKMQQELDALENSVMDHVEDIREVTVNPQKKDVVVELFGLGWLPNYAFRTNDGWLTVPAYE